jgi:ABC-type polysaccharide/polyol phosphate export permease
VGLLAVGIGWIAAALQVYLRDTAQVLAVVLTLWFWATPIFLDEEKFPHWARLFLRLNPLTYLVRAYRDTLLGRAVSIRDLASMTAFAVTAFVCGGLVFRYMKRGFADVL